MAIVRSIGKNTLGGGKKMNVAMHNYHRSTHDLSFVWRNTQGPGTLVPCLVMPLQPGDTLHINRRNMVMTHPTVGPLFGSFKQQTDFFLCPIRLYNAMLHNNTLNIGLDMSSVKLPQLEPPAITAQDNEWLEGSNNKIRKRVHPSCLLSYLDRNDIVAWNDRDNQIQITPLLAYYDIFKNYYANKQEKYWYTIGMGNGTYLLTVYSNLTTNVDVPFVIDRRYDPDRGQTFYALNTERQITQPSDASGFSFASGLFVPIAYLTKNGYQTPPDFRIHTSSNTMARVSDVFSNPVRVTYEIKENFDDSESVSVEGYWYYFGAKSTNTLSYPFNISYLYIDSPISLNKWELSSIDEMREYILSLKRNQYVITSTSKFNGDGWLTQFSKRNHRGYLNTTIPLFGLTVKTYQSDIFTNWVNTEWIDGENGINEITAIDTSSGSFNLDTLNLAQKVYNMLNRIAVSDGSYNSWIETVYTAGGVPHYETPVYVGGWSNEIEFQEVVSNSASEDQPLGSLAGRGVATNHKGSTIKIKADEPCYLIGINSITPRVDYYQYMAFDAYWDSLNDLHKPALDGIGFQDRIWKTMASSSITVPSSASAIADISIGKQPAWIDYMTNFNRTKGNFAIQENEGWMCLNRSFTTPSEYTTYIHPEEYNYVFTDTDITSQNFWIQMYFEISARRVMSAKQIPTF